MMWRREELSRACQNNTQLVIRETTAGEEVDGSDIQRGKQQEGRWLRGWNSQNSAGDMHIQACSGEKPSPALWLLRGVLEALTQPALWNECSHHFDIMGTAGMPG